jgi:hypothetical protein
MSPLVIVLLVVGLGLAWLLGSLALRVIGGLFVLVGLVNFALPDGPGAAASIAFIVLGVLFWLAGHWLYAYKHHGYASALAQRIFLQVLPTRMDPTRSWGVRVVNDGASKEG